MSESSQLPPRIGNMEPLSPAVRRWQEENQAAIDDYNRRVAEEGVFSDGARSF